MDLDIRNSLSLLAWERCYLFLCVNKALHYRNKVKEESKKKSTHQTLTKPSKQQDIVRNHGG